MKKTYLSAMETNINYIEQYNILNSRDSIVLSFFLTFFNAPSLSFSLCLSHIYNIDKQKCLKKYLPNPETHVTNRRNTQSSVRIFFSVWKLGKWAKQWVYMTFLWFTSWCTFGHLFLMFNVPITQCAVDGYLIQYQKKIMIKTY